MDRNWAGIRILWTEVARTEAGERRTSGADDGQSRLYGVVLDEVIETFERQLSEIEFFQNSDEAGPENSDVSKLEMLLWQI